MNIGVYGKRGLATRLLYIFVAVAWYLLTGLGRFYGGRIVVLCYHGIVLGHKEQFRRQLRYIKDWTFVEKGKLTQPKYFFKTLKVWVTFDDAFENLLSNTIPILEEYQIPAIIFAVSGNLGRVPQWEISLDHPDANEEVMTTEQLVLLSKNQLIRIGSHTMTHPNLATLTSEKVRQELAESKKQLEVLLGHSVEDLALPHGAFNETVLQVARQVGYKRIYTLEPHVMSNDTVHEGLIGRFSMSPDVWPIEFFLTCAGAYAWLLPWRRIIRYLKSLVHRN